jgi:hypothetical protein
MDLLMVPVSYSGEVSIGPSAKIRADNLAEAARNFRSMNDYMVKFTADSSTTYKMASAIYNAKVSLPLFLVPGQS